MPAGYPASVPGVREACRLSCLFTYLIIWYDCAYVDASNARNVTLPSYGSSPSKPLRYDSTSFETAFGINETKLRLLRIHADINTFCCYAAASSTVHGSRDF